MYSCLLWKTLWQRKKKTVTFRPDPRPDLTGRPPLTLKMERWNWTHTTHNTKQNTADDKKFPTRVPCSGEDSTDRINDFNMTGLCDSVTLEKKNEWEISFFHQIKWWIELFVLPLFWYQNISMPHDACHLLPYTLLALLSVYNLQRSSAVYSLTTQSKQITIQSYDSVFKDLVENVL